MHNFDVPRQDKKNNIELYINQNVHQFISIQFFLKKKILQYCKSIASGKVVESLSLIYMEKSLSHPDASPVPYVSIRSSE